MHSDPPQLPAGCLVVDSVTALDPAAGGAIVICGSHGGSYSAYLAAKAKVAGILLNDASVGMDNAGIGALGYLDRLGVPCATIGHDTARIGDGRDSAQRGIITHVNEAAAALKAAPGMRASEVAGLLSGAAASAPPDVPGERESRFELDIADAKRPVQIMDSNSLVTPEDAGSVIVTGSHGGLLGGRPETAVKVQVFAALYNDAGLGIDRAGISRLPVLDKRGIAAGTVSARSARIGDARSTLESGVVSHLNETARGLGMVPGLSARDFVTTVARA